MSNPKTIKLKPCLSDEEVNKLKGALLSEKDYRTLITYDADIYCEETGKCVAKFRKKVIPNNIAQAAFENLKGVSVSSTNRGFKCRFKRKWESNI